MGLLFLLPIVLPITIVVPFFIFKMLYDTVKKRSEGKEYKKELIYLILFTILYILFLKIFYF